MARNLTLNYGLRYEYYTPMREAHDLNVQFDIRNGTLKPPTGDLFQLEDEQLPAARVR